MKKLLKKRFLGIPMAVIAVILVAAVALAAVWITTELTSTGTITVTPPPTQTYEVDTDVLAFGDTAFVYGEAINVTSAPITITNTGEADINGIDVVIVNPPMKLTATPNVVGAFPLATGETAMVTVTLTCTPPLPNWKYALSGMSATLTPN